jgi:hypothetical protein
MENGNGNIHPTWAFLEIFGIETRVEIGCSLMLLNDDDDDDDDDDGGLGLLLSIYIFLIILSL